MGLTAIPMRADTGPIGGDMSHEFIILAPTGESEVFCHGTISTAPPPEDIDFDGRRDAGAVEQLNVALCRDRREARPGRLRAPCPSDLRIPARGIEVGQSSTSATKYSEPMKAVVTGPDGKEHAGADGLLRHRRRPAWSAP